MNGQTGWLPTVMPVAIVGLVVALRWWRGQKLRRLRLETMWIAPVLFSGVAAILYAVLPPTGWGWMLCVVAMGIGLALGWQRGWLMVIEVDPATHRLNHRPSPAALLFIVAQRVEMFVRARRLLAVARAG